MFPSWHYFYGFWVKFFECKTDPEWSKNFILENFYLLVNASILERITIVSLLKRLEFLNFLPSYSTIF